MRQWMKVAVLAALLVGAASDSDTAVSQLISGACVGGEVRYVQDGQQEGMSPGQDSETCRGLSMLTTDYFMRTDAPDLPGYPSPGMSYGAQPTQQLMDRYAAENCGSVYPGISMETYLDMGASRCGISVTNSQSTGDPDIDAKSQYDDVSSPDKMFKIGGVDVPVSATISEEADKYVISGVGRMFCMDMADWETGGDTSVYHGPMDFFQINFEIAKTAENADTLGSGAFNMDGEVGALYTKNAADISGSLTVLCEDGKSVGPSQKADGTTIAPCGSVIELTGDAHGPGKCTYEPGGACQDALTYMKGFVSDFDPEFGPAVFKEGLEVKNYAQGWVKFNGGATPAGYARDVNFIVPNACAPEEATGSGVGDPHFVGFNGRAFDYGGEPGSCFNLLTSARVHMNACLVPEMMNGLTYMGSASIMANKQRLQVTAVPGADTLLAEVGDIPLVAEQGETVTVEGGVTVQYVDAHTLDVVVPGALSVRFALHNSRFLDITSVSLLFKPEVGGVHGVLGQTADPAHTTAGYAGLESDYVVPHLWGVEYRHNLYHGSHSAYHPMADPALKQLDLAGEPVVMSASSITEL